MIALFFLSSVLNIKMCTKHLLLEMKQICVPPAYCDRVGNRLSRAK